MKRLISFTLILLLLLALSACKPTYSTDTNTYSDAVEITTDKESYPTNAKEIKFTVKNVSDGEECFGFKLQLLRNCDGEWKKVDYNKEVAWIDLAQILEPGAECEKTMFLSEWYRLPLEKGEYKIVLSDYAVSNKFKVE